MRHLILAMMASMLSGSVQIVSPAEFGYEVERDGTVIFDLVVSPDAWRHISQGAPLDSRHPVPTEMMMRNVSRVINGGMRRAHLCPGRWTVSQVIHLTNDAVIFTGTCGVAT